MVRRDAAGLVAAAAVAFAGVASRPRAAQAQATDPMADARQRYAAAEAALQAGRFDDAVGDYEAAYDASQDPALLYKIGRAHERAGRCAAALRYYGRYLREGAPPPGFAATTRDRIQACGGDPAALEAGALPSAAPPALTEPLSVPPPPPEPPPPEPRIAAERSIGTPNDHHKVAWLLVGSGIALVTLGGVLAYAATSSENDIRDLYLGFGGQPTAFDDRTRRRYDSLIDEGHRYAHLSWTAFGLAGAAAIGSALLFTLGRDPERPPGPRVTPVVTTTSAGVAIAF